MCSTRWGKQHKGLIETGWEVVSHDARLDLLIRGGFEIQVDRAACQQMIDEECDAVRRFKGGEIMTSSWLNIRNVTPELLDKRNTLESIQKDADAGTEACGDADEVYWKLPGA